jgi:hypothetical protein
MKPKDQTRTHLDREGEPAEAGAADFTGGPREVVSRSDRVTHADLFETRSDNWKKSKFDSRTSTTQ